jgi:hypothetical protein
MRSTPLVVGAFAFAAIAGTVVGSSVGRGDDWGCAVERRGYAVVDSLEGATGAADAVSAAEEWIPLLAEDGTVAAEELRVAFENTTGPNSYDPDTGELRIDGSLQAIVPVGQQPDGTWLVGSFTHCMRPP